MNLMNLICKLGGLSWWVAVGLLIIGVAVIALHIARTNAQGREAVANLFNGKAATACQEVSSSWWPWILGGTLIVLACIQIAAILTCKLFYE